MYDNYPDYDIPENSIIHKFFTQRWSALLIEILLMVVLSVAAGRALDPFGTQEPEEQKVNVEIHVNTPSQIPADGVSVDTIKDQGIQHIRNQEYPEAVGMYDLVLLVEPNDPNNYAWRGYANINSGDYEDARTDYSNVLELNPDSYDGHNSLCWAYGELEQFDTALSHCDQAIELSLSPVDLIIAYENRCWVNVQKGDYTNAYNDCNKVFEVQPNCTYESCALAHYNLGRIFEAQSEAKTALDHYNRAYLYGSQYATMYLDIAKAYENNGLNEAAIASYSKYIQLAGEDADPMAQSRLDAYGVAAD